MSKSVRGEKSYSKGAFLNVVTPAPADWEAQYSRLCRLPSLDHIEIWLEYIPTNSERAILKSLLSGVPLLIHGPFIHLSIVSHLEDLVGISMRRFDTSLECAVELGARVITFHAGTHPIFEPQENAFEILIKRFAPYVELKRPVVALENMPVRGGTVRECLARLDDLKRVSQLAPQLKFTLDVGHALQNGDDVGTFLEEMNDSVVNIHLHDGLMGGRGHLPLGAGQLDLLRFLRYLRRLNYSGYVGLELIEFEDLLSSWNKLLEAEGQLLAPS